MLSSLRLPEPVSAITLSSFVVAVAAEDDDDEPPSKSLSQSGFGESLLSLSVSGCRPSLAISSDSLGATAAWFVVGCGVVGIVVEGASS